MRYARKIDKNVTAVRRNRDHRHIGQLMKEILFFPADLPLPRKHQNNMCPPGLAVHYPVYETLLEYTTGECLNNTGRNWTKEGIHAAVMRVPHESAFADKAIAHFSVEAKHKVASKQARLVIYDEIRGNTQKQTKVSPIAAIHHKSKACRSILNL